MPKQQLEELRAEWKEFSKDYIFQGNDSNDIFDLFLSHLPAILESCLPEEVKFPEFREYLNMVEKATENGKYDEMFENGFNSAIQQTRSNIKELIGNK